MRISDWSSDVCSSDLLGIDQNVGDILYVAHLPLTAPHFEQRIVGGRLRVRRVEQQHASMPGAKAGRKLPVLALDVVDDGRARPSQQRRHRSEEHTSELQSLMRISYAVFCLKKKK